MKTLLTIEVPTDGTAGTRYVLTHADGQTRELHDGDDDYWRLAGIIERTFA